MAKVKPISDIGKKFSEVTPGRTQYYEEGVKGVTDWDDRAAEAEERYEAGIGEAIGQKRFGKGIRRVGNAGWQEGAIKKGTVRWGPGVRGSRDKYEKGFGPYRDAIEATDLPPRYAKGDPRNYERVQAIGEALRKKKEESYS